jgi:dihydroorotate dehydrogenase electron transfer subunit
MTKIIAEHTISEIINPSDGHYIIRFLSPVDIPEIKPGNFAEIKIDDEPDVFLRRPFSILDVDYGRHLISFYVKAIGKGTRKLGSLKAGQKVSLIYPLGNEFHVNPDYKKVLIVTGGSGIAPFILLGKLLKKTEVNMTFLIGGRSDKEILLTEEFLKYGNVLLTTEDGSLGEKGLVTQHSLFSKPFDYDKIYTCGPEPMMKAVAGIARQKSIPCESSLENMMACGFGICLCCVTPTQEGNKRVCYEGPVFEVNYLKWEN